MITTQGRLKKITLSLTPRQAVINLIEEHHQQFESLEEYARWLSVPKNLVSIHQRWDQVEQGVEKAMKGQPKEAIQKARQRCREDIAFLLALHNMVNTDVLEEKVKLNLRLMLLAAQIHTLMRENQVSYNMMRLIASMKSFPYPLDRETAEMAKGIVQHAVYFLSITDYQVERWLDEEEDATMAFDRLQAAVEALLEKGEIQRGQVVSLMTSPIMGFCDIPLIEGDWMDQGLVEMAEWGALLEQKGYQAKQPDDDHPLAMDWFYTANTQWGQAELPEPVHWLDLYIHRETVRANWQHYTGETKLIENRPYIRLADYKAWKKRFYKGDFDVADGILTSSWNQWVDSCQGDAMLGGIQVGKIAHPFDLSSFVVCEIAAEAFSRQAERREHIATLRELVVNRYEATDDYAIRREYSGVGERQLPLDNDTYRQKLNTWKQWAIDLLLNYYGLQGAMKRIEKQFFEGRPLLFRDTSARLQERVGMVESLVNVFNVCLVECLDDSALRQPEAFTINLDNIKQQAMVASIPMAQSMINRAKLQTLEQMGKNEAARALARQIMG